MNTRVPLTTRNIVAAALTGRVDAFMQPYFKDGV
jgi:hypothetical protein